MLFHGLFYSHALEWDAVDDAYISFRYARNAAQGHGLLFTPSEQPVEGYTNFLWTVLMVPLYWLDINVPLASILLGMLLALACLGLVYRLAADYLAIGSWQGVLAVFLLAADGSFALWAVSGMETHLFALLLLLGALGYRYEMDDEQRWPLSGICFVLAAMTRPEGLLVFALTVLHQLFTRYYRHQRLLTYQDIWRIGLFFMIWSSWFFLRWNYYGYPLPNTFYAKVTLESTDAQWARGLAHVDTFVWIHLGKAFLVLAVGALFVRSWSWMGSYLLLIVTVYSAYIAFVGGDWSIGRFFAPLLPMYYLLVAAPIGVIIGWLLEIGKISKPTHIAPLLVSVALVLALCYFNMSSWNGEYALYVQRFDVGLASQARTEAGLWLHKHVPDDALIAVDAAGQIPYYAELPTIDMFGINDLYIAHLSLEELAELGKTMGAGVPGHEKMDWDYVMNQEPDYVIIYGTMLDGITPYQPVDDWTNKPRFKEFLTIYRRNEPAPPVRDWTNEPQLKEFLTLYRRNEPAPPVPPVRDWTNEPQLKEFLTLYRRNEPAPPVRNWTNKSELTLYRRNEPAPSVRDGASLLYKAR
jgi:hypothetical protein